VDHAILIKSADFSWEENSSKPTLRNVSFGIRPGEKVANVEKLALASLPF
jgi:ABC-type multidrug transport system fused ATPase/permease subunit